MLNSLSYTDTHRHTLSLPPSLPPSLSLFTIQYRQKYITDFEVIALSPNQLFISWNLPEYPNGILTKYTIVVYNKVYGYMVSQIVPTHPQTSQYLMALVNIIVGSVLLHYCICTAVCAIHYGGLCFHTRWWRDCSD